MVCTREVQNALSNNRPFRKEKRGGCAGDIALNIGTFIFPRNNSAIMLGCG
jgi:hypothetical protein